MLQLPANLPRTYATTNLTSHRAPLATHASKQQALTELSEWMQESDNLTGHLRLLHLGLSGPHTKKGGINDGILHLFENRTSWNKKCTESGSLALVAFALMTFGDRILDESGDNIDKDKLELALNMLFGKDMPSIGSQVMKYASRMRLSKDRNTPNDYTLFSNSGYQITVTHRGEVVKDFEPLINAQNVNGTYFQKAPRQSVENFFSSDIGCPTYFMKMYENLDSPKAKIDPDNPAPSIKAMCNAMKATVTIYDNTTRTTDSNDVETEDSVRLQFLTDSAPTKIRDHRNTLRQANQNKALNELPLNTYRAFLRHKTGETNVRSHITCSGAQFSGTEGENIHSAKKVIKATVDSENQKRKVLVADIRLLAGNTRFGNERSKYDRHTEAMTSACKNYATDRQGEGDRIGGQKKVTYIPVWQETHGKWLTQGHTRSSHELTEPTIGDDKPGTLPHAVAGLFDQLPPPYKNKYRPIYSQWRALYEQRNENNNAIQFATMTSILSDAFNEATDTQVELMLGCKSAKDRTPSVLAGVALLKPLIQSEIEKPVDERRLDRFFTPHFDYDALTPDEQMHFKKQFDLSLLQSVSKFNTGAATNVNTYVLKEYFKDVPFIQECDAETVRVGG
jgi:hypothetical protein